jgi:glycosyltransferase involved in cell wall biosynthesis
MHASEGERLECEHISFPILGVSRFLWVGRLKHVINWIILGAVCCAAMINILRRRIDAIVTVLHGRFYFAAALAAFLTRTPYVVVVHDDFVSGANRVSVFSARILRPLTKHVLRGAANIYAVSPQMRQLLMSEFDVDSELQLPATARPCSGPSANAGHAEDGPVVVFAGGISYAVEDSLNLLATLITSGAARTFGISNLKLRLFSMASNEEIKRLGWDHPNIECKGWVSQSELPNALSNADILFLPYSFAESSRHAVATAFPSKTADYLASGKPILILAPNFSTLVRYAREEGFGEIVDQFSADALGQAIHKIAFSPTYQASLANGALQVFSRHHDIVNQRRKFFASLAHFAVARVP